MNLYWRAQIAATAGFGLFGAYTLATREMHLHATVPIMATVDHIDRSCGYVDNGSGATTRSDCKRADLAAAFHGEKRVTNIDGTADVAIVYAAPQDGSFQTGTIHYTGQDDAFYQLKAGDAVAIRVARNDPSHFTLD